MEKLEFIMMFFVILASLAVILRCAFRPFRKKKEIYGIPVEVIKNLKDVWQDNPGVLSNIPRIIEHLNAYEDEMNRKEQERETRMGQYAMLEKKWKETGYEPAPCDATLEEFQLWSVLVAEYPMERSLLMERELQRICGEIVRSLSPEDRATLLLLNRKAADQAVEFWQAFCDDKSTATQ